MAVWGLLSTIAIFGAFTDAIPTIAFPLNSQVPLAARVANAFSYTLSNSTFSSSLPMKYSLSSGPDWLSLDGPTLTLTGTPSAQDVGKQVVTGVPIEITATDSTGSVTMNSTLVVSKNPAPSVDISPTAQLPSFGVFSSPSTLLYHPSSPFEFKFDPGTFSGTSLNYYAITTDGTPLPAWVNFDASTLAFSGETPDYASLIQPPQKFGIQLIASDVEGFAGTSISFIIEVGVHLLSIVSDGLVINASVGERVNYKAFANALQIDGRTAQISELTSVDAKTPSWLVFDNTTLAFSGTVPSDAVPFNITVTVADIYEDEANATILIDVPTAIFSREIGDLNVTMGSGFSFNLSSYLENPSDVDLETTIPQGEPWIGFNAQTFLLSGNVPTAINPSEIEIIINATSKSSKLSSSQSFKLVVTNGRTTPSSFSTIMVAKTATSSKSATIETQTTSSSPSGSRLSTGAIIAVAVPLSLLLISIILALSCCLYRRRTSRSRPTSPSKSEKSTTHEPQSSVVEILDMERPSRIIAPEPLELDMSGFGRPTSGVLLTTDLVLPGTKRKSDRLRRSQTASAIVDPRMSRILRESRNSGNRTRSHSENALSKTERSWSTTQGSVEQTTRSSGTGSSHRLTRNYSNYSRKGHTRRSARVISALDMATLSNSDKNPRVAEPNRDVQENRLPEAGDSILNLQDSSFAFMSIDNFSALATQPSMKYDDNIALQTARSAQRRRSVRASKRYSKFMPNFSVASPGIGHGGRDSISLPTGGRLNRRSVGHGQDWVSPNGISRDSRTWLTVATAAEGHQANRQSNTSNYSVYPEAAPIIAREPRMSVRMVPPSSSVSSPPSSELIPPPSRMSSSSIHSRPVSRRVGSSPFFGGNSIRSTGKASKRMLRTSYADSPTVPEEAMMPGLEETVFRGMRTTSADQERDSFGISYGMAREGTRQLRSYVQSHLARTKTRGSLKSIESRDSRFESAPGSMLELHNQLPIPNSALARQSEDHGDGYEEFIPEDATSLNSWETNPDSGDSLPNVVEYAPEDQPEVGTAEIGSVKGRANSIAGSARGASWEKAAQVGRKKEMEREMDIGPKAKMFPGIGKRPISVGMAAERNRSSRVLVETGEGNRDREKGDDYRVYI